MADDKKMVRYQMYVESDVLAVYEELSQLSGTPTSELFRMQLRGGVGVARKAIKAYKFLGGGRKNPMDVMAALADKAGVS